MTIKVASRVRIKSENYGLPLKKKFPINTKGRAVSAIAYSVKGAREGTITPKERDIVIRKVKAKYPEIDVKFKSKRR
jgi:hypothetical protein